jgi:hypothetical protein
LSSEETSRPSSTCATMSSRRCARRLAALRCSWADVLVPGTRRQNPIIEISSMYSKMQKDRYWTPATMIIKLRAQSGNLFYGQDCEISRKLKIWGRVIPREHGSKQPTPCLLIHVATQSRYDNSVRSRKCKLTWSAIYRRVSGVMVDRKILIRCCTRYQNNS